MPGNRNVQETPSGVDLPVAIEDGGTSATSAADARTALGVPAIAHNHVAADVTDLGTAATADAADFAATVHTHAEADVTGLTDALAAKAASSHAHVAADITDLGTAAVADTTDFAAAVHAHVLADITDAGTAAASDAVDFAAAVHTHLAVDVTDLGELATLDLADLPSPTTTNFSVTVDSTGVTTWYATYADAKTAATSGDIISVYGGPHNITDMLKTGVTLDFKPGSQIVQTSGTTSIFDDTSGAMVCKILGFGYFDQQVANKSVLNLQQGASKVTFNADMILASGSSANCIYQDSWSEAHVRANVIYNGGNGYAAYLGQGYQDIECLFLGSEGGGGANQKIGSSGIRVD